MRLVKKFPLLLGLSASLLATTGVWALPSDRDQPIHVQADSAELDDQKKVAVYRGDVVITQGTMKITGDTVTITQNARGEVDVFTSVGKPAYYEQQPKIGDPVVKAYGLTIQYFSANERITLTDQAKVIQQGNTFEGEKIVYDTRRQIVNAGRANDKSITVPRPRIDMIIQPQKRSEQQDSSR